jgi:hypothetical protein
MTEKTIRHTQKLHCRKTASSNWNKLYSCNESTKYTIEKGSLPEVPEGR